MACAGAVRLALERLYEIQNLLLVIDRQALDLLSNGFDDAHNIIIVAQSFRIKRSDYFFSTTVISL